MGFFTRFKDIVNANINSMLEKAEDPEKLLKLMIQEMEDTLINLKCQCAGKMAEEIRLSKEAEEADALVKRWENRAIAAVKLNKDELAREALIEKKSSIEKRDNLEKAISEIKLTIKSDKSEIDEIEKKLSQAKSKLQVLKERDIRANNASRKGSDMERRFSEMEDRINRQNCFNDLNSKQSTEDKFRSFEQNKEIEEELERLKREIEGQK